MRAATLVTVLALATPLGAGGQVNERVAEVEDGVVRFSYATKPDVEICERGIRRGDHHMEWRSARGDQGRGACRFGPAEVEVTVRRGQVRGVEIVRAEWDRDDRAVDLGEIPAGEAARYLLSLARTGSTSDAAEEAILPALLANGTEVWRDLLDVADDRGVDGAVRKSAIFWLGQEAAAAVTEELGSFAEDDEQEQEIRDAAIFALSQRPKEEGIPILMEIAQTGNESETRRKAMFWLAQSDDARVISFFEDILLGRGR